MAETPKQIEDNRVARQLGNYSVTKLDPAIHAQTLADPHTLDLARRGLKSPFTYIREVAIEAASDIALHGKNPAMAKQAQDLLRHAALEDNNVTVRLKAAEEIKEHVAASPAGAKAFIETVQHGISDPAALVRSAFVEAARAFFKTPNRDTGIAEKAFEMTKDATQDPVLHVRLKAYQTMSLLMVENHGATPLGMLARAVLQNAAKTDPDPAVRAGMPKLLQKLDDINNGVAPATPKPAPTQKTKPTMYV